MIQKLIWILLPLAFATNVFGQDDKEKEDKIEALKVGFITKELNLTTSEAEKFWPIYNEMDGKMKELRQICRKINQELRESEDKISNDDARKKLNTLFENDQKELDLKKEYSEKFIKIIGEKRSLKLLSLEHEFRRALLDRLKDRRGGEHPDKKSHGKP
ncbi:hypothetical protein [Fluviicola taffensis]|uniref:Sensor of ECF-type sigma factor n=1 Tax=Fluviicola taffensis (strain DSM 16823 / NCIMB 13979 / RW262) TaxID=755732 RepID=F2IAV5_FLUTR|nr:hypothetical protein [Fluviicola taffensis]AEA45279.1 hypothetical protein Fluta_3307 [Fluviicola taffensis DSM 16823]